jgi:hypothetical protein
VVKSYFSSYIFITAASYLHMQSGTALHPPDPAALAAACTAILVAACSAVVAAGQPLVARLPAGTVLHTPPALSTHPLHPLLQPSLTPKRFLLPKKPNPSVGLGAAALWRRGRPDPEAGSCLCSRLRPQAGVGLLDGWVPVQPVVDQGGGADGGVDAGAAGLLAAVGARKGRAAGGRAHQGVRLSAGSFATCQADAVRAARHLHLQQSIVPQVSHCSRFFSEGPADALLFRTVASSARDTRPEEIFLCFFSPINP